MSSSQLFRSETGNPFVDAGLWVLTVLSNKDHPSQLTKEDLTKQKDILVDVLSKETWKKNLYSIFPNSKMIQPSFIKSETEKEEYSKYLDTLIDEIEGSSSTGSCIVCGLRDVTEKRGKHEIPLIGSSDLRNFFPSQQDGGEYCSACTYAVQFIPFALWKCGNFLLMHSISPLVMKHFTREQCKKIKKQITSKNYTGVADDGFTIPENALFTIIEEAIINFDEVWIDENPSITYYYFSNYGQSPDVRIYRFPNPVFRFIVSIKLHEQYDAWREIVWAGFSKKAKQSKKKKPNLKKYRNNVYTRLLNNQSIIRYFFSGREVKGDWSLLEYYLTEVLLLKNERLDKIKELGDKIAEQIKMSNDVKRLNQLERCQRYFELRNILRYLEKDRINLKLDEPLFTFNDYVSYLFPEEDNQLNWSETRDIILFRIYELLHSWLLDRKDLEQVNEDTEELE